MKNNRFYIDKTTTEWQVVDSKYGLCISAGTGKKYQQVDCMKFCNKYVKIHGDINFNAFPYSLTQELHN